jgi:parvulin-like peptidyl-prolyl isomerase
VAAGLLVLTQAACYQPISGGAATNTASSRRTNRAGAPRRVQPGSVQLKIGTESIRCSDVWNPMRSEVLKRFHDSDATECLAFVEAEAAKWVTNKVAESLLYQRAALRVGSKLDENLEKVIDAQIRRTITEDFGGVQWRFEQHLAADGRTLDDVRCDLRREVIIARFLESEIKPKIVEPTRAELLALYRGVESNQRRAERRRMSLIDVRAVSQLPPEATEPTRAQMVQARVAALEKITAARQEITSGADFADVARRYSEGLHASDGGCWGWITRGSVRERFEPALDALFSLEAGRLSDIVETPDGYFLVRCDAIDAETNLDFAAMQPQLKEQHFRSEYNRLVASLLAELQDQAHLTIDEVDALRTEVLAIATRDCQSPRGLPDGSSQQRPSRSR